MVGGVVSTTVTVPESLAVSPPLSVAVQVTELAPKGKVEPTAGEQLTEGVPSSASDALPMSLNTKIRPPVVFPSRVTSLTVIVGGVFEGTKTYVAVMVVVPVEVLTVNGLVSDVPVRK
jgi:hypothetical protein